MVNCFRWCEVSEAVMPADRWAELYNGSTGSNREVMNQYLK
jgi:hypothetical protein